MANVKKIESMQIILFSAWINISEFQWHFYQNLTRLKLLQQHENIQCMECFPAFAWE